jgi:pimeloyl-ACP methyl ester carboxylesterase
MSSASTVINSTNVRNKILLGWNRARLALTARIAPGRAVDAAARLFATPPRFAHTPREVELLATGTRFDVSTPDGRIAAWRFGEPQRPAVVFSHGWGGRGAQLRAFVPALLDAGYQVVLFDHVAHGSSEGRRATLVHFMKGLDSVVKQLESEGTAVAGMVAHSLGAAATAAWLNETRREVRVVLIAPPTSVERYSGYFARTLGIPESVRRSMQERIERRYGYRWSQFELPQSVELVRASALVIHDAGDTDVAPSSGLALARAWRGARFLCTRGLGHRLILRDPAVVADAVDFLADRVVFSPPPRSGEASAYLAPAPLV